MGTNFYAKRKLKSPEKQELLQKLKEFFDGEISNHEFKDLLETKTKEIHLGKRSAGWQFLWHAQPEYYQENLESIKDFLSSGEYEVYDEYGRFFSLQEFMEEELGEILYSGYTHESFLKDHPDERPIPLQYHDWITSDGLRFTNGDFS